MVVAQLFIYHKLQYLLCLFCTVRLPCVHAYIICIKHAYIIGLLLPSATCTYTHKTIILCVFKSSYVLLVLTDGYIHNWDLISCWLLQVVILQLNSSVTLLLKEMIDMSVGWILLVPIIVITICSLILSFIAALRVSAVRWLIYGCLLLFGSCPVCVVFNMSILHVCSGSVVYHGGCFISKWDDVVQVCSFGRIHVLLGLTFITLSLCIARSITILISVSSQR